MIFSFWDMDLLTQITITRTKSQCSYILTKMIKGILRSYRCSAYRTIIDGFTWEKIWIPLWWARLWHGLDSWCLMWWMRTKTYLTFLNTFKVLISCKHAKLDWEPTILVNLFSSSHLALKMKSLSGLKSNS